MKKKNKFLIYISIIIGFVLIVNTSCKKDKPESISMKTNPTISWTTPADITYGTLLSTQQLNATANVPGTFIYTPGIGTKLNIDFNQELKVDFTPTDTAQYNKVSKTVKINVHPKYYADITWPQPADIIYETLLSTQQLNAIANVPGTYVYTPAIRTKLNIGIHELKVDFTPDDTIRYLKTSEKVKIMVKIEVSAITISDAEGNIYHTLNIGTQTWMAENLKTTRYNNGTPIPLVRDSASWINLTTPGYCWYNNDSVAYKNVYGALYNWHTVNTGDLCPQGWRVPSDEDWVILINLLGYTNAGGKLKEAGTSHWDYPNEGADNSTGFKALPGGTRNSAGQFVSIGYVSYFWSSNANGARDAYSLDINYLQSQALRVSGGNKKEGYSVRCLKN